MHYLQSLIDTVKSKGLIRIVGMLAGVALLIAAVWYVVAMLTSKKESFDDMMLDAPKTESSTEQALSAEVAAPIEAAPKVILEVPVAETDATVAYGDATLDGPKYISAADLPRGACLAHYRNSASIVDDFPSNTRDYTPYNLDLSDPSTYQTEAGTSQLALRAIKSPYYEMHLSDVLMGNLLPQPESDMSRDGSSMDYPVVQRDDIRPIIVSDIGQGGLGGVAMD